MSRASLDRIASEIAPVRPVIEAGRFVARVTCDQCGAVDNWSCAHPPASNVITKKIEARGWRIKKRCLCPLCQKKELTVAANVTPIKQEASDAAKKAKRLIYAALEDYYDDQARRYRPGHTDKSIAEEIGVSEAFVKKIREDDYGPLAEPDEVAELRVQLSEAASEIGKLRARFDSMVTKNGWRV